jgi:hypothetical protein
MNTAVVQNTSKRNIKPGIKKNHHRLNYGKKHFLILKKGILIVIDFFLP